ncbi:MAG: Rrf2 family transcriptional regulator [Candidatus Pacebacteria bacterium]|nr:Rrf2 family transcriptional regulator [Candidatus Paceibacterota bacterium]
MKISTKAQYGLRALIVIAKAKKKFISLKEISEKENIPFDYLEKIVSKLQKEGLVKTKKGRCGGYSLTCSPRKIKIKEIIEALEGDLVTVRCLRGKFACPQEKKCLAKNFWQEFKNSIEKTLNKITLADLLTK